MSEERTTLEVIAPTVEDAITKGLNDLGLPEEAVEVEVLDQGSRGIFGIGSRQARIRLTIKNQPAPTPEPVQKPAPVMVKEQPAVEIQKETAPARSKPAPVEVVDEDHDLRTARETVSELLEKMGVQARVTAKYIEASDPKDIQQILVEIHGNDLSILIGRKSETLNALQYISSLIIGKELGKWAPLQLDVEGYRMRRERVLTPAGATYGRPGSQHRAPPGVGAYASKRTPGDPHGIEGPPKGDHREHWGRTKPKSDHQLKKIAMRAVDVIIKKRDRQELSKDEIEYFVQGFTGGEIPDYQVSAWAMAVLLNSMTPRETTDLTLAMAHSGELLDLTGIVPIAVDKHSTGGVGDKTTFVVEPVVASCGLAVGKMSGRGLGFSGGTLDKIESIPGFRTNLSREEFLSQLKSLGLVLTGQSTDLAPADGKLYSLRDVTGTVQSIPLIASSVMSKKIAAGAQAIVLDVKTGLGAFMQTLSEARQLAELMVSIGRLSGRKVVALLSDMNQPLGHAVGNALELREALETLHGQGPSDFREHCLLVAAHMLVLGEKAPDLDAARKMAEKALAQEAAWEKFRALVRAQGGDVGYIDHPEKLPKAPFIETVTSPVNGWVSGIHARLIGEAAVRMGAGRARKGDPIDLSVGVVLPVKVGDRVKQGQQLFTLHASSPESLVQARSDILSAFSWSSQQVEPLPLVYGVVGG